MLSFSIKKTKKLRAKVKLTVLFKNKAANLERNRQKLTKRIEIHLSQITNHHLLFLKRFAKM